MDLQQAPLSEDVMFLEFRNKIRGGDVASASTVSLLRRLKFSGRVCLVVQNGTILKAGYEEGYFTRRDDARLV